MRAREAHESTWTTLIKRTKKNMILTDSTLRGARARATGRLRKPRSCLPSQRVAILTWTIRKDRFPTWRIMAPPTIKMTTSDVRKWNSESTLKLTANNWGKRHCKKPRSRRTKSKISRKYLTSLHTCPTKLWKIRALGCQIFSFKCQKMCESHLSLSITQEDHQISINQTLFNRILLIN